MEDCNHENVEFDWGKARPSMEHVMVPGWCPDCETPIDRHYTFERQTEVDHEARMARAEMQAEQRAQDRVENHFDEHGHH